MMTSPWAKSKPAFRPAVCPKFFRNRTTVMRESTAEMSERILKVLSRLPSSTKTTLTISGPGVLDNDTDANLDTLTALKIADPAHGTLTLSSDGSFTYTPT